MQPKNHPVRLPERLNPAVIKLRREETKPNQTKTSGSQMQGSSSHQIVLQRAQSNEIFTDDRRDVALLALITFAMVRRRPTTFWGRNQPFGAGAARLHAAKAQECETIITYTNIMRSRGRGWGNGAIKSGPGARRFPSPLAAPAMGTGNQHWLWSKKTRFSPL